MLVRISGALAMSALCASAAAEPLPSPLRAPDVVRISRRDRAEVAAARSLARAAARRPAMVSALDEPMLEASVDHLPFMLHGVDASVTLSQAFPLSSVRSHRRRAAEAASRRDAEAARTVSLDVSAQALGAFFMLAERRGARRVAQEQVGLARQVEAAATARYAAGQGQQADVLRAQIDVARASAEQAALDSEVRAAEAMLRTSLGQPAAGTVPPLAIDDRSDPPSEADAIDGALRRRPELAAMRAEIERGRAEVDVMDSMYAPMAIVRAGPAYTMADGPGAMFMVGLSLPIWRERLSAGAGEASAMLAMSRSELTAMRRMIEGEAAAAVAAVRAARTRLVSIRDEVVPRARQAVDATLSGYGAGRLPLLAVLDAARTLWEARMDEVMAEARLGLAWTDLERVTALGGGTT